jgi:hypothetical protein
MVTNFEASIPVANIVDPVTASATDQIEIFVGYEGAVFGSAGVAVAQVLPDVVLTENAAGRLVNGSFIDVFLIPRINGITTPIPWATQLGFTAPDALIRGTNGLLLSRPMTIPTGERPVNAIGGVRFRVNSASITNPGELVFSGLLLHGVMWNLPGLSFDVAFGGDALGNVPWRNAPLGVLPTGNANITLNPLSQGDNYIYRYSTTVMKLSHTPVADITPPQPPPPQPPPTTQEPPVIDNFIGPISVLDGFGGVAQPLIQSNGTTYLVLRAFAAMVDPVGMMPRPVWNSAARTATITAPDPYTGAPISVVFTLGSYTATRNGQTVPLSVAPYITAAGSIALPVAEAAGLFGYDIEVTGHGAATRLMIYW